MKRRSERSRKQIAFLTIISILTVLLLSSLYFFPRLEPQIPQISYNDESTDELSIVFPPIVPDTDDSPDSNTESETIIPSLTSPIEVTWEPVAVTQSVKFDGETLLFASINRPVFTINRPEVQEAVNALLLSLCEEFVHISQSDKILAEEAWENAMGDFEAHERSGDATILVHEHYLSVLFNLVYDTGGADLAYEKEAFVFDLRTGERIQFSDFIGKDEVFSKEYIQNIFDQMIQGRPESFYDNASEILSSTITLHEFYLTDTELVLFFAPGILSPDALGICTLPIPYSLLGY